MKQNKTAPIPTGEASIDCRLLLLLLSDQSRRLLGDIAEQFSLEDKLALLILLRGFVCLVVFPANRLLALLASDVPDNVTSCRHVALARLACLNIHNTVE